MGMSENAWTLRKSFLFMLVPVGINQGALNTVLVYASTIQQHEVGYSGSAILNVAAMVSSLLMATIIIERVGSKGGVIVGMLLSVAYIICSAVAADACLEIDGNGSCTKAHGAVGCFFGRFSYWWTCNWHYLVFARRCFRKICTA
jgi:hypothetical protein